MTAAERCRRNGWVVGARLRGTERGEGWSCVEVIEITAIGDSEILAKVVEEDGVPLEGGCENMWDLWDRRWRRMR